MNAASDNTLLTTPLAHRLFHEVARDLPVIDFHNHLDQHALAADCRFANLAQLWVNTDPYKHRTMRIAGVHEAEITRTTTPDRAKFDRWTATVPLALGNPLHAWTRLELARYFDITEPLASASADRIWETANAQLAQPTHTARRLLARENVAVVCTSDRLLDDLSAHDALSRSGYEVRVLPSLRADEITAIETPGYAAWLAQLGDATGIAIHDWDSFCAALTVRLDAFSALGCRLSDHALDGFRFVRVTAAETASLFTQLLSRTVLDDYEQLRLRSGLLAYLGNEYARRGWVLQLHIGAQRFTSSRLRRLVGPAGGYAGLGNATDITSLAALLDTLESSEASLPRTILYPLNPTDYAAFATLTGSYAADGEPGLVQLGPAWWFNDHDLGIRQHLDALSRYGLLATFIGMTTDSRSLLSMVRHEYFRRVLCAWLGEQARDGHMPADFDALAPLVRAVCHDNAARYLRL